MKFVASRKTRAPVINLTSLIDVIFLLVIFLLLVAKFEPYGSVPVTLTQISGADSDAPPCQILTITAEGTYYLQKELVAKDKLLKILAKLKKDKPEIALLLSIDKNTPSGITITTTRMIKQVGIKSFHYLIKPE